MYDNTLYFKALAQTDVLDKHGLEKNRFVLATLHRNTNTDDTFRLNSIFRAFQKISLSHGIMLVLPLHPRTRKQLDLLLEPALYQAITGNAYIKLIPPASFLEMIQLEQAAKLILTDSGGVQKRSVLFT